MGAVSVKIERVAQMGIDCEENNQDRSLGSDQIENYTFLMSWKCSPWYPTRFSACCSAIAFVGVIVLFVVFYDVLFGRGFSGGTAGLGLVLMYIPFFGVATLGFVHSCIAFLPLRRKCEAKLAMLSLFFSLVALLPAILILGLIL